MMNSGPLLALLSLSSVFGAASSVMSVSQRQASFVPAAATDTSSSFGATPTSATAIGTKRSRQGIPLCHDVSGSDREGGSPPRKRRAGRPPRRGSSSQSRNGRQFHRSPRAKSHAMCPPLNGPVGAPALPVLTTRDPRIIERWIDDHVNKDGYSILGFDSESIAKPPWNPERASLPDGPATIQLSTPASCLVVQLARCGDGSALHAPETLRAVINDPKIIKVGVSIDDDALELYRWSTERHDGGQRQDRLWDMTSRFDLGCILPDKTPSRRVGIRELALKVLGVEVVKSKKLSMSNWGKRHLDFGQVAYAARDAWVSAAIVDVLQKHNNEVFGAGALMAMEFMTGQRKMSDMDERARHRKAAKLALKEIVETQKADGEECNVSEEDEVRKQELYGLLDMYRPDQPPRFDEDTVSSLPLH